MEKLALYDDNNNVINEYIERCNKLSIEKGRYFRIVLIFIQNEDDKFLIQKCSKEKNNEIATTGGHVTYKDSSIYTVKKEIKEELGIDIDDDFTLYETIKYDKCYSDCYYIKKNIDLNSLKLQESEVDEVFYLSIDEIDNLINENNFRKSNIIRFHDLITSLILPFSTVIFEHLLLDSKFKSDFIASILHLLPGSPFSKEQLLELFNKSSSLNPKAFNPSYGLSSLSFLIS